MDALVEKFGSAAGEQAMALTLTMQGLDEMIALFEKTRECVAAELRQDATPAVGVDDNDDNDDAMQVEGDATDGNGAPSGSASPSTTSMLLELGPKTLKIGGQACRAHKKLHSVYATLGKAVDKMGDPADSLDSLQPRNAFAKKQDLLDQSIMDHFNRVGRCDWTESMIRESKQQSTYLKYDHAGDAFYKELGSILDSLDNKDVVPALNWCHNHAVELGDNQSGLEFALHRQMFVHHLRSSPAQTCVHYATNNLSKYMAKHDAEFQKLMGALMFCGRLEGSPYETLTEDHQWTAVKRTFANEFCHVGGLPARSPLAVSIEAGCEALPTLVKYKKVSSLAGQTEWTTKEEMPVEVPLTNDLRFHSIFCCPVGKEQSSASNPPMMLPCGHVLGQASLFQLTKRSKVKCPYCPRESRAQECRKVHF